ncbi:hypothetical protein AB4Y45_33830 [Paraburkholderia sp. EG287A]|uniref:hypothetical protein n=1 Tax=Paraburkholderia sp. EG287A TaxID=3237012 RepID=UPI0034D2324C
MLEAAFEFLSGFAELFGGCGWPGAIVVIVCALLGAAVYGGSQFELADIQACQAKGQCVITTDTGPIHFRHLVQVVPASNVASAPAAAAAPTPAK